MTEKTFRQVLRDKRMIAPHTVYAMRCKENGRVYIGCTTGFKARVMTHLSELKNRKHSCAAVREDAEKYGVDGFEFYKLEEAPDFQTARAKEYEFIKMYRSKEPEYGYNIRHSRPMPALLGFIKDGLPPLPKF